jgi:autotransporter passenger strand-loop-strand repeat protein
MEIVSSGIIAVSAGVSSTGLYVIQEGVLQVLDEGKAQDIGLAEGGRAVVSGGGTLYVCAVSSGGTATVMKSGFAQDVTVEDGGLYLVSSGGTAHQSLIQSGGAVMVSAGAFASNTTVNSGGSLIVSSGATATKIKENGDGIFVDDEYTDLPEGIEGQQARIARIDEIRAGAGDDIVDMTSNRIEYTGDGLIIRGGAGNDVIWANKGDNLLFGDAGDDRIAGASGCDVIAGGIGNDRMHGGGGTDTFVFCDSFGTDTIEQLADGFVLLWFASGSEENWDESTLTYTQNENNRVTVSGVSADQITLKFDDDGSDMFDDLVSAGAFLGFSSEKIFEENDKGILA